jgi:sugar fermentation stimulation protein A
VTLSLALPHRFPGPFVPGRLVARPNRFLAVVRLASGEEVRAHVGDRGRLEGILFPGAEVWLAPAPPGTARTTAFTLACARRPPMDGVAETLVAIDPVGANRLVRALLEARELVAPGRSGLPPYGAIRAEVAVGHSRFDFALDLEDGRCLYLEVKSALAVGGKSALFPDAPSARASRHCRELAAHVRDGGEAAIVLVSGRADVEDIRPHPVDPVFAVALAEAKRAGVRVLGVAFETGLDGFRYAGRRPVRVPRLRDEGRR